MDKTHWKKAFKSDYLASSDIDGSDLALTIRCVKYQECVTASGKKFCNVAHFVEQGVKPMILNVTNSKIVKTFANGATHLEDWNNIPITVYVDPNVRFGNETTEGLRIRPVKRATSKPELIPGTKQWDSAIEYLKKDGTITNIESKYRITENNRQLLLDAAI